MTAPTHLRCGACGVMLSRCAFHSGGPASRGGAKWTCINCRKASRISRARKPRKPQPPRRQCVGCDERRQRDGSLLCLHCARLSPCAACAGLPWRVSGSACVDCGQLCAAEPSPELTAWRAE